jgi:hypothetical protein
MSGLLRKSNHPNASLGKWVHRVLPQKNCLVDVLADYGGAWTNAVLYRFIYGDEETIARTPTEVGIPKSIKLGLGQYVMRSGYESDASQVVFWATPWLMYGHAPATQGGQFTIHKFGNLILHAANGKSGMAEIRVSSESNVFRNTIGIHKGVSDSQLNFDGEVVDSFWSARNIRIKERGKLLAEDLNAGLYDYVALDVSVAWKPTTADVVQREFVYLRGPVNKEFVVVFDRVNVKKPATDEKIWKIWVPTQPVFENGTPTNPRQGKWMSTNTDVISVTNKFSSSELDGKSASTHGKFYMKIVAPQNRIINVLGGSGKEYQSGDDDGTTPYGAPSMTQFAREHLGWGRIEIRPTITQNYDIFFNVVQFGDANTLSVISPINPVNSVDDKLLGVHIGDPENQWLIMFPKKSSDLRAITAANYGFTPVASVSKHLLTNMQPVTVYHITHTRVGNHVTVHVSTARTANSESVSSNSQGVLHFTLNGRVSSGTKLKSSLAPNR